MVSYANGRMQTNQTVLEITCKQGVIKYYVFATRVQALDFVGKTKCTKSYEIRTNK